MLLTFLLSMWRLEDASHGIDASCEVQAHEVCTAIMIDKQVVQLLVGSLVIGSKSAELETKRVAVGSLRHNELDHLLNHVELDRKSILSRTHKGDSRSGYQRVGHAGTVSVERDLRHVFGARQFVKSAEERAAHRAKLLWILPGGGEIDAHDVIAPELLVGGFEVRLALLTHEATDRRHFRRREVGFDVMYVDYCWIVIGEEVLVDADAKLRRQVEEAAWLAGGLRHGCEELALDYQCGEADHT